MIGKPSGYIDTLPKPLRNRIAYLGELQDQHDELEEKLHEEQAALQRKYTALYSTHTSSVYLTSPHAADMRCTVALHAQAAVLKRCRLDCVPYVLH